MSLSYSNKEFCKKRDKSQFYYIAKQNVPVNPK